MCVCVFLFLFFFIIFISPQGTFSVETVNGRRNNESDRNVYRKSGEALIIKYTSNDDIVSMLLMNLNGFRAFHTNQRTQRHYRWNSHNIFISFRFQFSSSKVFYTAIWCCYTFRLVVYFQASNVLLVYFITHIFAKNCVWWPSVVCLFDHQSVHPSIHWKTTNIGNLFNIIVLYRWLSMILYNVLFLSPSDIIECARLNCLLLFSIYIWQT